MTKTRRILFAAGLTVAGAAAGFAVKALAEGIPSQSPLYYSGTLTENGALVNDSKHTIGINLYADATSTSALCQTSVDNVPISNGRFRIALDPGCKAQINANPGAQIQVFDGTVSLGGRTPIGAVPYAVEADHAVNATNATNATAGGALAATLTNLQNQVHPASAFSASLSTGPDIPTGTTHTQLLFDTVLFDSASEYNATTGTFTPKSSGTYLVACTVQYTPSVATGKVAVFINDGATVIGNNQESAGTAAVTPASVVIAALKAGDAVTCSTDQTTGTDQTTVISTVNQFSAARLY
jgi:hypothetical protein